MTFSLPRLTADQLSRLHLACDDKPGVIAHIGLRVRSDQVRFCATNGRLLASLVVPLQGITGEPADLVLDADQFTTALKLAAKAGQGSIQVRVEANEARITSGTLASVVRRIDGLFPNVDHVFSRTAGRRWIPTLASLNPSLVAIVAKISGVKRAILFSSPSDTALDLQRLWEANQGEDAIRIQDARQAISAPAYWADHELAFLLMPVIRCVDERQFDLAAHGLPQVQTATVAA